MITQPTKETGAPVSLQPGLSGQGFPVELWPLARIIPYARNARKIPQSAIDKVAASIQEFGWRVPIVVDVKGVIVAGHTRLLAAQKLGLSEAPVHVAAGLSPAQIKAYRLMDNRSHEESSWDFELLGPEISELRDLSFDIDLTGFNTRELDELLLADTDTAGDEVVPPLPENPASRPGDLWLLGSHRLLCGDATKGDDVARLLNNAQPFLCVTDPPYGVSYDPEWRVEVDGSDRHALGKVQNDDQIDWSPAFALFPGQRGVHLARRRIRW
jgi:ParB-like chromosome segregation protein Spo0J